MSSIQKQNSRLLTWHENKALKANRERLSAVPATSNSPSRLSYSIVCIAKIHDGNIKFFLLLLY
jgi:hypothetical protein